MLLQQAPAIFVADLLLRHAGLLQRAQEEVVVEGAADLGELEFGRGGDGIVDHPARRDDAARLRILAQRLQRDQPLDRAFKTALAQEFDDRRIWQILPQLLEVLVELVVHLIRRDRDLADLGDLVGRRRATAAQAAQPAGAAGAETGDNHCNQHEEENADCNPVLNFLAGHGNPDEGNLRGS